VNDRIYMSSPDVAELEEQYVIAAMRSGWIAPLGPDVDAFEAELAGRVGVAHGVALSSGTAALHLGLLGLGVGRGDIVLTSTMTFAVTANAIIYTGAEPHFIDCALKTGNTDPALLTGLRSGEKLHEELIGIRESTERPLYPGIAHTEIDSMSPDILDKVGWTSRLKRTPFEATVPTWAQSATQQSAM